jgi:pyruvate formate lyase activating enzyme
MKEAMLYSKEADNRVACRLCRHLCRIADGDTGICNVRLNKGGTLYSIFYGQPVTMSVDPIEKKPLFHFYPGTAAYSIATMGCNFQCPFCQNWQISQYGRESSERAAGPEVAPEQIVAEAKATKCKSISYTYTEPTIFFEYAYDTAKLAKAEGLYNNFVTNGYMTREAIDIIHPYLDAANIDLKSFRKETYRKYMKGQLDGVLDSIKYMKQLGIWIELTTLVVTGMNDSEDELRDIANFIVETGRDIPWHISAFFPTYNYTDEPSTNMEILNRAYEIGKEAGLRYVYLGNVRGGETECTSCYKCDKLLIIRRGYHVRDNFIAEGSKCPECGASIDGVGMDKTM